MKAGGVTASLQSIGATGGIKTEAKHAIAAALRRSGLISDRDYLTAITGRSQYVVVSVPSYFSSPSPEIPLIMSDYRENGYNHRMAEQMLQETHLHHGHQPCTCHCREHGGGCRMKVESIQRLENRALFQRFKAYEAIVAEDLSHSDVSDEVLVHGTRKAKLNSVLRDGLRTKFSLQKTPDGLYGRGLYFATNSCKAFQYAGHGGCIILCRVVLGRIERLEDQCYRRFLIGPPFHSAMAESGFTRGQDQVHDEFIVYNDEAVYPEFVLTMR